MMQKRKGARRHHLRKISNWVMWDMNFVRNLILDGILARSLKYVPWQVTGGYDRRCVYTDGDIEDLRVEDLEELAKLDPQFQSNDNKKPRLSLKISLPNKKADRSSSTGTGIDSPSKKSGIASTKIQFPLSQSEYTKLLLDTEYERDVQTTNALAQDILDKSAAVNDAKLPGMQRTRDEQMERIKELINDNHAVMKELEEAYAVAKERREEVRVALGESTCLALGVEGDS